MLLSPREHGLAPPHPPGSAPPSCAPSPCCSSAWTVARGTRRCGPTGGGAWASAGWSSATCSSRCVRRLMPEAAPGAALSHESTVRPADCCSSPGAAAASCAASASLQCECRRFTLLTGRRNRGAAGCCERGRELQRARARGCWAEAGAPERHAAPAAGQGRQHGASPWPAVLLPAKGTCAAACLWPHQAAREGPATDCCAAGDAPPWAPTLQPSMAEELREGVTKYED